MNFKAVITKPLSIALLLFIISIFTRTLWLDKIPIGIVNDNMIFVLNAQAVFYTGRDVTGLWHPLSFSTIPDEPGQAEIPYAYLAPTVGLLSPPMFAAHIFHAVANAFLVAILFLIVLKLLGKGPALIVGLVAGFNPWNIFFSRSAFEVSLALFFYVVAFLVLLKTKGWHKLWTIIPLALGFYTYMAYKVTFLPYVFLISYYVWSQIDHKKYTRQYIALLALCLLLLGSFLLQAKSQSTSNRLAELSFVPKAAVEEEVNMERKIALRNPVSNIFSNKATVSVKKIIVKYLDAFSPKYLFMKNEDTLRFNMYNHGYFYYLDLLFFILGFYYLFTQKRKLWLFLTTMILIAPLPTIVSSVEVSYAMRSSLYIPFIYIFIGAGIWYALMFFRHKTYRKGVTSVIIAAYAMLIVNFLYTYFFIQPVYGAEGSAFSARLLSRYADLANQKNKKLIVEGIDPKVFYKDFIYYSGSYNKLTSDHFKKAFLNRSYSFENLSFKKCGDIERIEKNTAYIFDPGERCEIFKNAEPTIVIPQLSDSGTIYVIYHDSICSQYNLRPFVSNLRMSDFSVEQLSEKNFCETYIIDYQRK